MASCTVCEQHTESTFRVEGLCCHQEAAALEKRLSLVGGVHQLTTDVVAQRMRVQYDAATTTTAMIAEAVAETGMRAWVDQDRATASASAASAASDASARWQARLLGVAAAALGVGLVLNWTESWTGAPRGLTIAMMMLAVVTGGVTTVRRAVLAVKNRTLDMYVLMLVAVIGASLIGEWFEAATVVVLFALAQVIERRSLDRARRAIGALIGVTQADVRVRRGHHEMCVPLDVVRVGELMLIAPGERIALDGQVIDGISDVNQAPVTGESVPVTKEKGDRVFAGTINGHGALEVRVTAVGDDTTIARVIHLVERAQAQRAPSQAWVDRFAHRYTPIVLAMAAVVAIVPPLLLAQPFSWWIYRALVLLVIACPCALVLSTPISIVSALAAAAKRGVLIKGGVFLEKLATVRALALDKTGTLTRGALAVHDVIATDGHTPTEVIAAAAALGARSGHPLDRAVSGYAVAHDIAPERIQTLRALPGHGVIGRLDVAKVDGDEILIGNARLFDQQQIALDGLTTRLDDMTTRGMTIMLVARAGHAIGAIGLRDEVRLHSREAIDMLRTEGITHVALLTGDHEHSAQAAGDAGNVDAIHAGLLPADKVTAVERLRATHGTVAMVGDGINDAPALAAADIGIAMGVAGTDAAIETADIALMADDLRALSYVVRLGRRTVRTVKTNVAIALGLKLAFMTLAIAGLATLWMAVVADMGASLIVVANALHLLRTR
jgi:Cd2+/Zn2+-exporting ATPase